MNEFEKWLEAKGFDADELSDAQSQALRAAFDAEQGSGGTRKVAGAGDELAELKKVAARRQALTEVAVRLANEGAPVEEVELKLEAAFAAGQTPQEFELNMIREFMRGPNMRSHAPAHDTRREGELLEAAIAIQCGLESQYDEKLCQQAEDKFPGLKLTDVLRISARRNGYVAATSGFSRELLRAAFAPVQARGSSTYDLSGVLSNVANKAIRDGFNAVDSSWRAIAAIARAMDFKTMTHYALTGDQKFEQVGNSGELKHATMGEESYSNKVDTYGKIFAISRQDFINDDLGAFNRIRTKLGRGAALAFNEVFWGEFLADLASFYTTGRKNLISGGSSALSSSSLASVQKLLRQQTDPDGNNMGLMGRYLVVPPALEVTADELYVSTNNNTGGSATAEKVPNRNVFAGKYQPVVSPYIAATASGGLTGGSDTHFFVLTDPMDVPVIEAAFLNGRQQPTVEAADADFDILGVQMRGYFDFGVSKQEYRGAVRSAGA